MTLYASYTVHHIAKTRKNITDFVEQHLNGFYEYGFIKFVVIATPYYKCLENNCNYCDTILLNAAADLSAAAEIERNYKHVAI